MLRPIDVWRPTITARRKGESLDKYLQEISRNRYDVLSIQEEVELCQKIQMWDEKAKEKLIGANTRFVVSIAKQYTNDPDKILDLIQEGNIWLIKAASMFDVTRWFKFISYAVWRIRQSILQYIIKNSTIRLPLSQEAFINKMHNFFDKFFQENNRFPSDKETMDALELKEQDIQRYHDLMRMKGITRLETKISDDDESTLLDLIPDNQTEKTSLKVERESMSKAIMEALKSNALRKNQKYVIVHSFWIWGNKVMTTAEMAMNLDFTEAHIRNIRQSALLKLQKILKWSELETVYNSLND